jgi:hypothetical protein
VPGSLRTKEWLTFGYGHPAAFKNPINSDSGGPWQACHGILCVWKINHCCFFLSLVVLGFELRASITRQLLYHLSHTSAPFCFSYFLGRASVFFQESLRLWSSCWWPPMYLGSQIRTTTTSLLVEIGLTNFFARLTSNCALPNLYLLSCNYRHAPPCLANTLLF